MFINDIIKLRGYFRKISIQVQRPYADSITTHLITVNIVYITVLYGLRRSEVLGLKWDSVDFKNKLVTIKHTVVRTNKIVEKDRTKTDSSFRTFPMSKEIETLLLNLREEENKNRLKYKENYIENDYIFKWPDGTMYNPDQITKRFIGLLKKYGLPPIRFHDLRHSLQVY